MTTDRTTTRTVARTLDIAVARQRADVAAERHCYATAHAYLDIMDALIDGRDHELDTRYAWANVASHREHAADATGYRQEG